jgi:hypothetical protein
MSRITQRTFSEDRRQAAQLSAITSGQLTQAAIGLIAAEAAYVVYVMEKSASTPLFLIFATLTVAGLTASIMFSGWGITATRDAGYNGNWTLLAGRRWFNRQAWALLCSLVCLLAMIFVHSVSGKRRPHWESVTNISIHPPQLESIKEPHRAFDHDTCNAEPSLPTGKVGR